MIIPVIFILCFTACAFFAGYLLGQRQQLAPFWERELVEIRRRLSTINAMLVQRQVAPFDMTVPDPEASKIAQRMMEPTENKWPDIMEDFSK